MVLEQELEAAVDALNRWDGESLDAALTAIGALERAAGLATREAPGFAGGERWCELLKLSASTTATLIDWASDPEAPQAELAQLGALRSQLATATLFRVTARAAQE
ncbi:MAG: hypothetical protein U1E65_09885 [Myxococcota bacterium]